MLDLTTGDERRLILKFAWPMILGNIFQNLYSVVDSIVVGNYLGKASLGAIGAAFPIIFALISLVIGIGSGASIVISQFFGANNIDAVKRTIDTTLIFLLVASLIVTAAGIPLAEPIFHLMGLPVDVMPEALDYIHIYLSGMVFFFGFNSVSSILRGMGDSVTPLYFMIGSTIVNIVLDVLFVSVFEWGIESVAWATIIAQGGAFITAVIYLNKNHNIISINVRSYTFDLSIFKECIRIGLPTGIQQALVAVGMTVIMGVVSGFGTNAIAAYSVAMRIDGFAKMPAMNFASALSAFVGQNMGAGRVDRVKRGMWQTMIMSLLYSLFVTSIIVFFGEWIMSQFTDDAAVVAIGYQYLQIIGSFFIAFSVMFTIIGMLRGAGATMVPMYITLVNLWIIKVPLAIILSKYYGVNGIWWSFPIAWIVGAISAYLYMLTGRWKKKGIDVSV